MIISNNNTKILELNLFIKKLNLVEPGLVNLIEIFLFRIKTKKEIKVFNMFREHFFKFRNFKTMYYNYQVIDNILKRKCIENHRLNTSKLFSSIIDFLEEKDTVMFLNATIIENIYRKNYKFILIDIILKDKKKDYKLLINTSLEYSWFEVDRLFEPMRDQNEIIDRDDLQKLFLDKYVFKKITNPYDYYYRIKNLEYSSKKVFGESVVYFWGDYNRRYGCESIC